MSTITLGSLGGSDLDVKPRSTASATSTTATSTSGSNSSQTSLSSLGATFMSLLVKELQNQDPTSPMDSTQMVGQMVSLNQLDQLASIHELLTDTLGTASTSASVSQTKG